MIRWISLACGLLVAAGGAAFVYQSLPDPVPDPDLVLHGREGPAPKVEVVGELQHNFGTLPLEGSGSHTWQFRNVGQGNLEVWLEESTCSCTVAKLKGDAEGPKKKISVPPGESTPIEVSWVAHRWGRFGHTATMGTNDPERPAVMLTIYGLILAPVDVQPSESISFSDISNEEPQRVVLSVTSPDRVGMRLTQLITSRPDTIKAESRAMSADELAKRKVKSGYEIAVTIRPGLPLGRFSENLTIGTDHPERPSVHIPITGNAVGPITAFPSRLQMTGVVSAKGGSQEIALVVRGVPGAKFEVVSKPKALNVAIEPESRPGARGQYRLTARVPPGTSPGAIYDPIVLKTDHPRAPEVKIPVSIFVTPRSGDD